MRRAPYKCLEKNDSSEARDKSSIANAAEMQYGANVNERSRILPSSRRFRERAQGTTTCSRLRRTINRRCQTARQMQRMGIKQLQ